MSSYSRNSTSEVTGSYTLAMSNKRIIIFTIVTSLILLKITQTSSTDGSNKKTILGKWYRIAVIFPEYDHSNVVTCYTIEFKKPPPGSEEFIQVFNLIFNGYPESLVGLGQMHGDEMRVRFPSRGDVVASYTIASFNDFDDLIIHDRLRTNSYGLISRHKTVSKEALQQFENLANGASVAPVYYSHQNCSY